MSSTLRRLSAVILALVLASGAGATLAADPSPSLEVVPTEPISIHAEMLAEHEPMSFGFQPGAAALQLDGGGAVAAASSLPNGLFREVFGYLPYWALTSAQLQHLDYGLVSTIAYFGVPLTSAGNLQAGTGWDGWTSSAMTSVINAARQRGVKVVLTVTMMGWSGTTAMETLLNSATNRANAVNKIVAAVKSRGADGVNVDFEPVPSSLRSQFTAFVRQLKAGLVAQGAGSYLTVATMAGAATWSTGYDVAALTANGAADQLMVMAYDFHYGGSARAGGVAPHSSPYIFAAAQALADHLKLVPASKLIWGVPYYGRAWTTESSVVNARTCKTTSICPTATSGALGRTWAPRYIDALEVITTQQRQWDGVGRVPWYRYWSSTYGTWVQGYYDDVQSLTAKYDMINQNGLGGVGIWHLLMDAGRSELWSAIDTNFQGVWFEDILGSQFRNDILAIAEAGITGGCGGNRFCPTANVTREQMASFLARALKLPSTSTDYFTDDNRSPHQGDINRLAAAGITGGCAPGRFCPSANVTREQMAGFLNRGFRP
jgi:spore germination protein YaaH